MNPKKLPVALMCLVLLTADAAHSADGTLSRDQVFSLFHQANDAFRRANATTDDSQRQKLYEKAILSFERIINDGQIRNARLYYNLANTYFLKGELGKAIVNYRRAEQLDKADANIKKNLSFARDKRTDRIKVKTEKRVLHTLFFWHYDFSVETRFVLACICFAVICISLSAMTWFGRSTPPTVAVVICGLLLACFSISVVLEATQQADKVCGVIAAQEVVAHQADWQDSPPSFKEPLHAGTEFDLIEHRPGWFHIALTDGSDGWIRETSAELI